MSSVNISRNIYQGGKQIRSSINFQGYTSKRTVSVVTQADRYEDPAWATAKPFEDIPKVPMFPVVGSSWVYFPIIGKYSLLKLHEADRHKHEVYGDIVREKFGHVNMVSAFVPEAQEAICREEGKFPFRPELSTMEAYRNSRKEWYKTAGVINLRDQEWWDLRKKTQKHLMKPKAIQAYLQPMQDVAMDLVNRIRVKKNSKKEVDGFLEDLYKWSLESVGIIGLDIRLGSLDPNLAPDSDGMKLIKSVQTQFSCMNKLEASNGNIQFWKYLPSPTWNKYVKACDDFTGIAFKYINRSLDDLKKRADEERELTMLQNMLMNKDLDVSEAMVMVADMLFAGVDTTSHSVGFLLYHLSKNPDKQKILADEIRQLLPSKEDRITPEIYNELHYLKACFKESIRLLPIVRGNSRIFDHDVVICGYKIPAGLRKQEKSDVRMTHFGQAMILTLRKIRHRDVIFPKVSKTIVFCALQQVCRDEKYFKNADKFMPERWINKEDKVKNPYAYVPFGTGIRSCIGRRLAELEIMCLVTHIIRNFKVEYHYGDIDMITRMVSIPDKPLNFRFLDR